MALAAPVIVVLARGPPDPRPQLADGRGGGRPGPGRRRSSRSPSWSVTDAAGTSAGCSPTTCSSRSNAMLLAVAPLVAALVAVALVAGPPRRACASRPGLSVALAAVVVVALFGYAGALPAGRGRGAPRCPRRPGGRRPHATAWQDPLIGEAIIRGPATPPCRIPTTTTLLWDGAGTLPNLWVASLHGALSKTQQTLLPRPAGVPLRREDARLRRPGPQPATRSWSSPCCGSGRRSRELLEAYGGAASRRVTLRAGPHAAERRSARSASL